MPENPLMATLHRAMRNKAQLRVWAAIAGRLGSKGLVALSRGYLGPLADAAARRAEKVEAPAPGPAEPTIVDATGHPVQPEAGAPTTGEPVKRVVTAKTRFAGLGPADLAILGLAATKLVYEIGEIALYNPKLDPAGKQPEFKLDAEGRAPAMSIAHVAAAVRLWQSYSAASEARALEQKQFIKGEPQMMMYGAPQPRARLYAARSEYYGTAPRYAYTTAQPMLATRRARYAAPAYATHDHGTSISTARGAYMSTSSRCGSCGGTHAAPPAPTPTYDPCAGGLRAAPRAPEGCGCGGRCGGGCGCGCTSCRTKPVPTKTRTYDNEQCPTFAISCETKLALRDCMKTAVCDFLQCVADTLCPDGRFDSDVFSDPNTCKQLVDCVGQLACSFMHCVPEALCGPKCDALPAPNDCVPCDYAVEVVR